MYLHGGPDRLPPTVRCWSYPSRYGVNTLARRRLISGPAYHQSRLGPRAKWDAGWSSACLPSRARVSQPQPCRSLALYGYCHDYMRDIITQ